MPKPLEFPLVASSARYNRYAGGYRLALKCRSDYDALIAKRRISVAIDKHKNELEHESWGDAEEVLYIMPKNSHLFELHSGHILRNAGTIEMDGRLGVDCATEAMRRDSCTILNITPNTAYIPVGESYFVFYDLPAEFDEKKNITLNPKPDATKCLGKMIRIEANNLYGKYVEDLQRISEFVDNTRPNFTFLGNLTVSNNVFSALLKVLEAIKNNQADQLNETFYTKYFTKYPLKGVVTDWQALIFKRIFISEDDKPSFFEQELITAHKLYSLRERAENPCDSLVGLYNDITGQKYNALITAVESTADNAMANARRNPLKTLFNKVLQLN